MASASISLLWANVIIEPTGLNQHGIGLMYDSPRQPSTPMVVHPSLLLYRWHPRSCHWPTICCGKISSNSTTLVLAHITYSFTLILDVPQFPWVIPVLIWLVSLSRWYNYTTEPSEICPKEPTQFVLYLLTMHSSGTTAQDNFSMSSNEWDKVEEISSSVNAMARAVSFCSICCGGKEALERRWWPGYRVEVQIMKCCMISCTTMYGPLMDARFQKCSRQWPNYTMKILWLQLRIYLLLQYWWARRQESWGPNGGCDGRYY